MFFWRGKWNGLLKLAGRVNGLCRGPDPIGTDLSQAHRAIPTVVATLPVTRPPRAQYNQLVVKCLFDETGSLRRWAAGLMLASTGIDRLQAMLQQMVRNTATLVRTGQGRLTVDTRA